MPTKIELLFALEELAVIYRIMQDTYRARAYKNAISDIDRVLPVGGGNGGQRNHTLTAADIETLRPILTPKMLDKVREFIESGKIAKLEALKRDPKVKSFERILKIYGVGPKTAARWIAAGIKTELDVADAANRGEIALTRAQRLGLRYYHALQRKMSRRAARALAAALISAIDGPDILKLEVAGSYRRGKPFIGDLDILIATRDGKIPDGLEARLKTHSFFIDTLETGKKKLAFLVHGLTGAKCDAMCDAMCDANRDGRRDNDIVVHVDIIPTTLREWGAALLYFTGSGKFNYGMRAYAKLNGLLLNEKGLFRGGELIPALAQKKNTTEKNIFDILGLQYISPQQREKWNPTPR